MGLLRHHRHRCGSLPHVPLDSGWPGSGREAASLREVLFEIRGSVGFAALNRPEALNALTRDMVRAYAERLSAWEQDPSVRAVVLEGTGGRAFCAGGDVRSLCRGKTHGDLGEISSFFEEEYAMDLAVARFSKPHLSLWDGVVMGGGVGISLYGSHRVATERTLFAMPETAIGFLCDVGATWFLPRLPGHVGLYLGLTGARLGPADAVSLGLATHYVPHARLVDLRASLIAAPWGDAAGSVVDEILGSLAEDPGPPPLTQHRAAIEQCFSAGTLGQIFERLEAEATPWAQGALRQMQAASPTSLLVVQRSLRLGAGMSLEEALTLEHRLSRRLVASHDFCEGVRALLEERDGTPQWSPARVEEVEEEEINALFSATGF